MSCRTETAGVLAWRFCPDDLPRRADLVRAVLRARLVDEITGQPIEIEVSTSSSARGLSARSAAFGQVGLVGPPARAFPGLGLNPVELDLRVSARGYLPLELRGMLGPIAGFPDQFAPLEFGDVGLHRVAVGLRGRTLRRGGLAPTVVDNAALSLLGYWPELPPANVAAPSAMLPPDLVHLSPPVYAAREAGLSDLRQRDIPTLAGEDKTLLAPAPSGARRLRLSNRSALAIGTILILDASDSARRERIALEHIDTASSDDQPAWVTLAYPLARMHRDGTVCQVGDPQAPGAASTLTRTAIPGDETLFLDALAGLASGAVVEIDDGIEPAEYHEVQLYEATSDTAGFFRLPPIARVAMVLLRAERVGLGAPDDLHVTPDYRVAENRLTVLFP